jgi:hypothetical protein
MTGPSSVHHFINPTPNRCPPNKLGKPKHHPAKNLVNHFQLRKRETLVIVYNFKVPFEINRAEHDLIMVKLKYKISPFLQARFALLA